MRLHWILGVLGFLFALAWAQFNPGPAGYYEQCRSLYQEQVLDGARAACELALVADPEYVPALKLLTRIRLEEGQLEEAYELLERLKERAPGDPTTAVLEARYLLAKGRAGEALERVAHAPGAEAVWLKGRALERLGRFDEALAAYREAALLGYREARLDAVRLLERLGKPEEALEELGRVDDPELLLVEGRLLWSAGRLPEAAAVLERALLELPSTDPGYDEALSILAAVYYGMGDVERGRLTLTQLSSRVNLLGAFLRASWLWLLGLVALVGLHLYGESRIEPISTLELRGDNTWGMGRLYGAVLLAWLLAAAVAAWLGWYLYQNWLAAFTPVQRDVVRPVFYLALALFLGLAGWSALRREDDSAPSVLGRPESRVEGFWVGLVLLVLLVGYAWLARALPVLNPFPFNPLLPLGALALASVGLAEPMLRLRAYDAYRVRYGGSLAPAFAVLLGGLVWFSPVVFWWAAGASLLGIRLRIGALWPALVGWFVLGLLAWASGFVPWVRALF